MRLIPFATLPVSRWTNGAGRKADILTGDGWLIGFAWLEADAPFSRLPGMDRTITLVDGPGFRLDIDGKVLAVEVPFAPARFDGGAGIACRPAGPSRVLNAMTDRSRFVHTVDILDRSGTVDPGDSVACVVVALDGPARLGPDDVLGPLDSARVEAPVSVLLSPGHRAAWVRIGRAS